MSIQTIGSLRKRHWCITVNNPVLNPEDFGVFLQSLPNFRYGVYQLEQTFGGVPHYQCYLEFSHIKRFTWLRKRLPTAHIEERRGTRDEARAYCQKDESRLSGPFERGEWICGPGHRSDIKIACEVLLSSRSLSAVAIAYPSTFVRYSRGFGALLSSTQPERSAPPRVTLLYGPTGSGKTRMAFEQYPGLYRKPPDTRWFDGYSSQGVLLLDDFFGAASKMSLSYLLQLLDRYPFTFEEKGSYIPLLATKIVITSNHHPRTWYNYVGRQESYLALARRVHAVYYFGRINEFAEWPHLLESKSFWHEWSFGCNESSVFKSTTPAVSPVESDNEIVVD